MRSAVAVAVLCVLAALAAAAPAVAAPTAAQLARACTGQPAGATFPARAVLRVRTFARCAVREVREDAGLASGSDARLTRAARTAMRAEDDAGVTRALLRGACPGGRLARVRWSGSDTAQGGAARTPLLLARFVLDQPHLRRRTARIGVETRAGRLLGAAAGEEVALLLASATCSRP